MGFTLKLKKNTYDYNLQIVLFLAVVFNDDDPKEGYTTLFLKVPDLSISKPFIGKAKPKNADIKFGELSNT